MLKKINFTYVPLIPKHKKPFKVAHLRPISLCNVIYKITSKVLTNLLKLILPHLISDQQSGFVLRRLFRTIRLWHQRWPIFCLGENVGKNVFWPQSGYEQSL